MTNNYYYDELVNESLHTKKIFAFDGISSLIVLSPCKVKMDLHWFRYLASILMGTFALCFGKKNHIDVKKNKYLKLYIVEANWNSYISFS